MDTRRRGGRPAQSALNRSAGRVVPASRCEGSTARTRIGKKIFGKLQRLTTTSNCTDQCSTGRCQTGAMLPLLPLLATLLLGVDAFTSLDVPNPTFRFRPGSFDVVVPKSEGMSLAAIHLTVNEPVHGTRPGKVNQDLALDGNEFRGTVNYQWQTDDVIYYWVYVVVDGLGYQRLEQSYTIRARNAGPTRPPKRGPFEVPTPKFHLTPHTITVTVPALPGISLAAIHMNLNEPLRGTNPGRYNKDMDKSGDVFVTVIHAPWKNGDTIHYWVYVIYEGLGHQKLEQTYVIGADQPATPRPVTAPPPVSSMLPTDCGSRFIDDFDIENFGDIRVANASEVALGDYPWQAQIQRLEGVSYTHHCGGIVISDRHILTAAHCLELQTSRLQVVVGQHDLTRTDDPEQQTFAVKTVVKHPDYGGEALTGYSNDIAIVLLRNQEIRFGDYVRPICVPTGQEQLNEHTDCRVSGWGRTSDGRNPNVLHGGRLPYVSSSFCSSNEVWGDRFNSETQLCAGFVDGGVDACGGDSGGPLACRNQNGQWTATGIVSWGSDMCGESRYVGVYTKVDHYMDWIVKVIEEILPFIGG